MFQSLLSGSEVKSPGSGWGASLALIRVPAAPFACESTSRQSHTHISASRSHSLRLLLLGNCSDGDNPEEWDIARAHSPFLTSYVLHIRIRLTRKQHCSESACNIAAVLLWKFCIFLLKGLYTTSITRGGKKETACACLWEFSGLSDCLPGPRLFPQSVGDIRCCSCWLHDVF